MVTTLYATLFTLAACAAAYFSGSAFFAMLSGIGSLFIICSLVGVCLIEEQEVEE